MTNTFSKVFISFFLCLGALVLCTQRAEAQPLVGKTLVVQGQSVSQVLMTFNPDGTFIQCTPGFSCEVSGEYKYDGGKLQMTYKTLFFDRNTLVRRIQTRDGTADSNSVLGRKIFEVREKPLVALSGDDMRKVLVGDPFVGVSPDGEQYQFTINRDGTFKECFRGSCDTGVWKVEGNLWVAKHDKWSSPVRYPDGYLRFPLVEIGTGKYQFAGIEVTK